MLKTNSKQVKEKIREYILEHFKEYYYQDNKKYIQQDLTNDDQIFLFIIETIKHEYNHEIKKNYNYLTFKVFKEYCQGLPSILDCDYYCHSAITLLGDILEQTQEERNKYTESQAEELMTKLLYNELIKYYN